MRKQEVRALSKEEREQLERLSRSQTVAYRVVKRAKIILMAASDERIKDTGQVTDCDTETVRRQVKRFNERGLASLEDRPRPGRKELYSEEERGQIIATARTHPQQLDQPFGRWTLTRLADYINSQRGIGISRAQLGRVLEAEGLRWYQEKTYFTERPDPQFAEKRGR